MFNDIVSNLQFAFQKELTLNIDQLILRDTVSIEGFIYVLQIRVFKCRTLQIFRCQEISMTLTARQYSRKDLKKIFYGGTTATVELVQF